MSLKRMNRVARRISVERLAESVEYNPRTGGFVWRVRPEGHFDTAAKAARWNGKFAGKAAFTSQCPRGYYRGMLDQRMIYAHRAAVALTRGDWPSQQVDHINRDKGDNTILNLRTVTHSENRRNTADCEAKASRPREDKAAAIKYPSLTGIRRVGMSWSVRIKRRGVERHIGTFKCFGAAVLARAGSL